MTLVLHSVNSADGLLCVDVFRRDDGSIGFEEFRRDPEDPGRGWFPIGFHAAARFNDETTAIAAAIEKVAWFDGV